MTTERVCPGCGASLEDRRAQVRFCSEACRKRARRAERVEARSAGNPDSRKSAVEARVRVSGPEDVAAAGHSGAAGAGSSWPELVVAAFRDDEDLQEHAGTWEAHFRERGELR